jgi:uncharacterized short protein YbdD (DUF466 family)
MRDFGTASSAARVALSTGRRLLTVARDVIRGACGTDGYRMYVAHLAARHPHETPLTREQFFRRETASRWDGVKRCC